MGWVDIDLVFQINLSVKLWFDRWELHWAELAGQLGKMACRPENKFYQPNLQGDPSRSAKPPVDLKTQVLLGLAGPGQGKKQNFCFEINGRFCTM